MRVLFCVLALMLACAATALAADTPSPPAGNQSGQAVLDACISKCLNVSASQISSLRAQGCSDADIATACAIAAKCGKPVAEVADKYSSSKDWKTTAAAYNLSTTDLVSAATMACAEIEQFNTAFCSQFYSIPSSTILQLRRQGYSWDDTNMMANAAVQTTQPITQIATLRSQGKSWADIASSYNVAASSLTSPAIVRCVEVTPCPAPCPAPYVCPPAGAGPVAPCPMPVIGMPCVICDGSGHIMLTLDQANDLYASGNDWLNVAVAVNIARYTGYPIRQILTDLKSLNTWQQVIVYYGVTAKMAFNVADYPFPRRSIYSASVDNEHQRMIVQYQKTGVYPTCPPTSCNTCSPPLSPAQIVPVPCPNPCPVPGATTPSTTMPTMPTAPTTIGE